MSKINFIQRVLFYHLISALIFLPVPNFCQKGSFHTPPLPDGLTTTEVYEKTDIPQQDIDDALILDYGRYTTLNFHYAQKQHMGNTWDDRCYDHYIKCYTNLVSPGPVCMFHSQHFASGYTFVLSYCDAYLDNCRRGLRYWRLLGYGKCNLGWYSMLPFMGSDVMEEV